MSVEGEEGEDKKPLKGEGDVGAKVQFLPIEIIEKKLTFDEASKCLNTLGQDESGSRYAYLMITATDRKLTDISVILNFKHVLFLDLSGNYLTLDSLQILADLPFLIFLKCEHNRCESMAFNKTMNYLQVLNLNRNLIKETDNLLMPQLTSLLLNYNDLSLINLDPELKLKNLELRANRLTNLTGNYPITVEKLYLADNNINYIDSQLFIEFVNVELLHLRDNHLKRLTAFGPELQQLKYLNLRNNLIEKFRHILKLSTLPQLEVLIILGNPIYPAEEQEQQEKVGGEDNEEKEGEDQQQQQSMVRFNKARLQILAILPNLKRLNKYSVTTDERYQASLIRDDVLRMIADEPNSEDESDADYLSKYLYKIGDGVE